MKAGQAWPALRQHAGTGLLLLGPLAVLAVVVGISIVTLVEESISGPGGWSVYDQTLSSPVAQAVLGRTLLTSAWVTVICLVLGYPYAYVMTVCGPWMRALLLTLVLLPFWTSFTIRTLAWVVLLQDKGIVNDALAGAGLPRAELIRNPTGVVIGMSHVLLPYAVLTLFAVMRRIDRRVLDAAAMCGAPRLKAFAQVYLPLSIPGVVVSASLVFVLSLGFFITPQLLGSPRDSMLSQLIYSTITQRGDTAAAAALGMVLLAVTLVLAALFAVLSRAPWMRNARVTSP